MNATRLTAGAVRAKKRGPATEGASTIERMTMKVKDQSRKVPEPIVVLAKVNGELLLSLLGANQARNRRAEGFRVAGCAVIGQRDGAESR